MFRPIRQALKRKPLLLLLAATAIAAMTAGCGATEKQATAQASAGSDTKTAAAATDSKAGWPEVLRYGVLPGENDDKISRQNKKFLDDMSKAIGIKTELFVGDDYTAVIEAMRNKKLDLASFGPFSYIIAHERSNAQAFAVRAASPDAAFYHSLIVVPKDSKAQSLADLKGKSILFADPASTSGHLFPRYMFVKTLGISNKDIESFFSTTSFSGGHDKSIIAIAHGQADAAGVCDSCIQRVIDSGVVKKDDFRVLMQSDKIPIDPLSYRGDLPQDLVQKIKDFIFDYNKQNPDFFKDFKATAYYPVQDDYYNVIRDTAKALNMSPDDILGKK